MNWIEDIKEKRYNFPMDYTYKRMIFKFYGLSFFERIRIVEYPPSKCMCIYHKHTSIFYMRCFGYNNKITNGIFSKKFMYVVLHKILHLFYKSDEEVIINPYDSKYVKKYPFIKNCFKEITRNEKLEKLLS